MPPPSLKDQRKSQRESLAKLKKQIRDTERLLKRPNLPPHIQIAQQRKLKALQQHSLPQAIKTKKEDSIAGKYKMVKFFEKKKILKSLKRAQSAASQNKDNEAQSSRLIIDNLKMQLNYIAHFPRGTPYISLFPRNPCTDPSVLQAQNAIMSDIEKRVKAGELEDASADDQNISESCHSEGEDEVVKIKGSKKDQKAKTEEPKPKKNRRDEEEEPEDDEEEDQSDDSGEYSESDDDDDGGEDDGEDDDDVESSDAECDEDFSSEAESSDEEDDE